VLKHEISADVPQNKVVEYDIGGRLMWPHGDCNLTLNACGEATLEFSEDDCLTPEEFTKMIS
jgi:hypothetical protein